MRSTQFGTILLGSIVLGGSKVLSAGIPELLDKRAVIHVTVTDQVDVTSTTSLPDVWVTQYVTMQPGETWTGGGDGQAQTTTSEAAQPQWTPSTSQAATQQWNPTTLSTVTTYPAQNTWAESSSTTQWWPPASSSTTQWWTPSSSSSSTTQWWSPSSSSSTTQWWTPSSSSSASPSSTWASSSASSASATSSSATSTSSAVSTIVPLGIAYSPYNDDSSCKSYDQVTSDLQLIHSKGISVIRIYGTDCNVVQTVLPNAQNIGLQVAQGFWFTTNPSDIDEGVQDVINWANSNSWNIFHSMFIANEVIVNNYVSVSTLLDKVSSVKSSMQSAGYQGKFATAEPPISFVNNPSLCSSSSPLDIIGINAHPYFDSSSSADQSGDFLTSQIAVTNQACPDKEVLVTETGYPSEGDVNGSQVPSPENQQIAVQQLLQVINGQGLYFTTYDDAWKSPGPYNVEQHFGMINIVA